MANKHEGIPEGEMAASDFEFEKGLDEIGFDEKEFAETMHGVDHFRSLLFKDFDFSDQEDIQEALLAMLDLHKDQEERSDGKAYMTHPLEVSRTVVEDFEVSDKDLAIASLLHDAVEDQALKIAKKDLISKYGSEVLNNSDFLKQHKDEIREAALEEVGKLYGERVMSVIKNISNPDFTAMASREVDPADKDALQARKNELYRDHVREEIEDPDTLVVKLADFMQNTGEASTLPESPLKDKHRKKYVPVIAVFIERLQRDDLPCPIRDVESVIAKLTSIRENLSSNQV